MITQFIKVSFLFFGIVVLAQPATEVYLMDLNQTEEKITISNFQNISKDPGYDNQPSFGDESFLYYAGNNNGQTDIALYILEDGSKKWFNKPTTGGEYSPTLIPGTNMVASVRLDTNGLQRLYSYDNASGESTELVKGLQVAYFAFLDNKTILSTVLSDGQLDLVLSDLNKQTNDTILVNAGRSIHKVPDTEAMSYTAANEDGNMDIYQWDPETGESYFVAQLPIGIQDHIWFSDSKLLCGSGDKLYLYDLFGSGDWKLAVDLSEYKIKDITRLAVSPNGTKLAIVAEPPSETKKE